MPDLHTYLSFLVAALILAVMPGPGLLYVLARSLGNGLRDGLQSSVGTLVGGLVHVLASAVGLSALIMASSVAFSVIRYAGAAYLIYLGVRTLLSRSTLSVDVAGARRARGAFTQGIVTEVLNPKTALFFLAFIPQFIHPGAGSVFWPFVLLGTTSVVLNTLADVAVACFAGPLGSKLTLNARFQRGQKLASGGAMIGLGAYAAIER